MANSQREDIIKNKENQVRILNIIRKMTLDLVKEFYTRFGRIKEYYGQMIENADQIYEKHKKQEKGLPDGYNKKY